VAVEWLYIGGALVAGFLAGALVLFLVRGRRPEVVEYEIVEEEPAAAPPSPPPPPAPPPEHHMIPPPERPPWARPELEARTASPPPRPPAPGPRPPASFEEDSFSVARPAPAPPRARSGAALPVDVGGIPTEWARRQVGPPEAGRAVGLCSGCGTRISVSRTRPLRIACPVCGRTRLLT
jgi:DNA-directed RNA polymerase subunit RPC12/RpoP